MRNKKEIKQHTKKTKGNRQYWLSAVLIMLAFLFVPEIFEFENSNEYLSDDEAMMVAEEFNGNNLNIFPKQKKIPVTYLSANDGDTIRVALSDFEVPVRYLMIDTPEMNYNNGSPEAFAEEAKYFNEELLTSADQVYIEFDVGPFTDNYDRLLAYVYADEILINEALLKEGLAQLRYINPPNNSYENLFRQAEEMARREQVNVWQ